VTVRVTGHPLRGVPLGSISASSIVTGCPMNELAGSAVIRKPYNIDELEQKLRHVMGASVN